MAESLASDVAIARLIQKLRGSKRRSVIGSDDTPITRQPDGPSGATKSKSAEGDLGSA